MIQYKDTIIKYYDHYIMICTYNTVGQHKDKIIKYYDQ